MTWKPSRDMLHRCQVATLDASAALGAPETSVDMKLQSSRQETSQQQAFGGARRRSIGGRGEQCAQLGGRGGHVFGS
jgi:hypothetical protein